MDSMSFSGKQNDILCVARSIEMSTVCVIMLIHVEECSIFCTTQRLTKNWLTNRLLFLWAVFPVQSLCDVLDYMHFM